MNKILEDYLIIRILRMCVCASPHFILDLDQVNILFIIYRKPSGHDFLTKFSTFHVPVGL